MTTDTSTATVNVVDIFAYLKARMQGATVAEAMVAGDSKPFAGCQQPSEDPEPEIAAEVSFNVLLHYFDSLLDQIVSASQFAEGAADYAGDSGLDGSTELANALGDVGGDLLALAKHVSDLRRSFSPDGQG